MKNVIIFWCFRRPHFCTDYSCTHFHNIIHVWIEALTNEKLILQTKEAQERDKFMNDKLKAAREQKVRERRASEIERDEQKKRWVGVYS